MLIYYQKKDINSAATDDLHLANTQLAKMQEELECANQEWPQFERNIGMFYMTPSTK